VLPAAEAKPRTAWSESPAAMSWLEQAARHGHAEAKRLLEAALKAQADMLVAASASAGSMSASPVAN
jgi:hypothetical protein